MFLAFIWTGLSYMVVDEYGIWFTIISLGVIVLWLDISMLIKVRDLSTFFNFYL